MIKKEAFRLIFIIIFILILINMNLFPASAEIEILRKCSILNTPNAVYDLNGDIIHKKDNCIVISAENITLNCKGYSIIAQTKNIESGILSKSKKTKIKNCVIEGFETGISLENSDDSLIINNLLKANELGLRLNSSNNVIISLNQIIRNEKGIYFNGENNVIANNEFCFNVEKDVSCDSNQSFENNHCDSGEVCGGTCFPCTHNDDEVYNCKKLDKPNTVYKLMNPINIYVPETCFFISSDNITLNGNGKSLNYMLKYPSSGEFSVYSEKSNIKIKNIAFKGTSLDYRYNGEALRFVNSSNLNILDNSFESIKNAISLQGLSEIVNITSNSFENLNGDAMYFYDSSKNIIKRNIIKDILGNGIYFEKGSENIIQENKISFVREKSIFLGKGDSSQIKNNYIESSEENSIEFRNNGGVIESNEILNSGLAGIMLADSNASIIKSNKIDKSNYGIKFFSVSNSLIKENKIYFTEGGILGENSDNVEIVENNVGSSSFGFKEESCSDLSLSNNTLCGNDQDVICSSNHIFKENSCNSGSVCGGECMECGKYKKSFWGKIKEFFKNLFS